jgi:hypothetical protein
MTAEGTVGAPSCLKRFYQFSFFCEVLCHNLIIATSASHAVFRGNEQSNQLQTQSILLTELFFAMQLCVSSLGTAKGNVYVHKMCDVSGNSERSRSLSHVTQSTC